MTIKGLGVFLAQFLGKKAPFNNLHLICLWAEAPGFNAVQIPTGDKNIFNLQYIDFYHECIKAFHVKEAAFNLTGKQGTLGRYQS